MDSARWEHMQAIFHEVLRLPPSEQEVSLRALCADDADLMSEVQQMLSADRNATSLFDRGLPQVAYQMIGGPINEAFREFGPYRRERLLGEGGMGVVWLARRKDTGHLVAIKFLPHAGLSPARRERFAREIRTLAKLKHPFIARLYDAGTLDDGTPWFVMEYVEGLSLSEYLSGSDSIYKRLELFRKICDAVQ